TPDVWPPDRGRCHTAARLTRGAAPAATPGRRWATADRPGGLGSAPRPRLLAGAAAQPGGLADVCPRYSARRPQCPPPGDPAPASGWRGHGSPRLPVSGPPGHGLLASPPHHRAWGRPPLCRGLVSSILCADAAHATILSRGEARVQQPVCGPRAEAGW